MSETLERLSMAQAPLSVLLIAFNAGDGLEAVIGAWDKYLAGLARSYEILVVNDGSSDDTRERADRLASENSHVRLQHHDQHRGTGAALRTGLQMAQYPLLVTAPCDKQFEPTDLYRLLEAVDQVDLVTGYRVGWQRPALVRWWDAGQRLLSRVLLGAAREPRSCWVGWTGWGRRWQARWVFGIRVQDPECPLRVYRRAIFKRIVLQSDGPVAQIEILAKANHLECLMAEVPVAWSPPAGSGSHDPAYRSASKEMRQLFSKPVFESSTTTR